VLDPDAIGHVAGMLDDARERRVGVVGEVSSQEGRREDDPDQAT
jgi:hypothetical protein